MSTTAGYFDETILNDIRVKAAAISFDDRIKQQYVANYEIIKAIQSVQTANVYSSRARSKDVDVEVIWQNVCGQTVEDNTTCEIGGSKSSTNIEEYCLTYEKVINFSEDEADFIDNEFDIQEAIAKQFLVADKNLTEDFAQYCVSQIEAFRGWNTVTTGKGTVSGADTYIAPVYWNPSLVAYFMRVAKINQFTSPTFVSGNNLYEQMYVAQMNQGNANGKGDAALWNQLKIYFDLFNIDTVNDPLLKTYMLSMGSLALAYRAWNPMNVEVVNGVFSRWQMKSDYLPFYYDVFYEPECTTDDLIQHNFKVKLRADLFNNPTGCDDNNTGVLSFVCGNA